MRLRRGGKGGNEQSDCGRGEREEKRGEMAEVVEEVL